MPGAFDYVYLHIIFSVRNSASTIRQEWRQPLQQGIASVLTESGHQLMASAVLHDHVHILVRYNPKMLVATMMTRLKKGAKAWLRKLDPSNSEVFRWQRGYAVFSVSRSRTPLVRRYFANQREYHKQFTLAHEMRLLLETPWELREEKTLQATPLVAEPVAGLDDPES